MLERVTARIVLWVQYFSMAVLFLLMLLVAVDVALRYIFNRPFEGGFELEEIALAIVALLGLGYTALEEGHVSINLVVSRFAPKRQAVVRMVNNLAGAVLYALIAWQGILAALYTRVVSESTEVLHIPKYPLKMLVPLGAILLCLVLITKTLARRSQKGSEV